ncbi:MAG: DUF4340 domain-containing protein [Ruminococcus sp.]|nr:DUF4340 domain-containing protein [Ruminococcus sp.]
MKRPIAALAVLVIAAGVSVGSFIAVKDKKDKDDKAAAEKAADNYLFSFDSSAINKAKFTCPDGEFTAELIDSEWKLTSGGSFTLDQDYVKNVCIYLSTLKADTSFARDESKLASYGLNDAGTIELYSDDETYSLSIGGISPTNDYYYITVDGRDRVYAISSLFGSVLKTNMSLLVDKKLVPYDDYSVAEIKVSKGRDVLYDLTFDKDKGTWSLPEKYSALPFNQSEAESTLTVLTRVTAYSDGYRETSPADLSVYGLKDPPFTAVITGLDGSTRTLLLNPDYDVQNGCTSVYTKETDQVILFPTIDLTLIKKTDFSFITRSVSNVTYADINALDLTIGEDVKAQIAIDTENQKGTCNGKEFSLSDSTVKLQLQNLVGSIGSEKIDAIDLSASPELKDPVLTAVFTRKEGGTLTCQFTEAGNDLYYVFIDGKFNGALTGKDNLSGKNSISYFYDEFLVAADMK